MYKICNDLRTAILKKFHGVESYTFASCNQKYPNIFFIFKIYPLSHYSPVREFRYRNSISIIHKIPSSQKSIKEIVKI